MSNEYKDWTIENYKEEITHLKQQRDKWKDEAIYLRGLSAETVAGQELAALRKKIEDTPVVAWLHEARQDSDVITNAVKHVWGGVAVGKEAKYTIPLISKEDLK